MSEAKNSREVTKFMTVFHRLRQWNDDDPAGLEAQAASDSSIKELCDQVHLAATVLLMNERRRRRLFAAPVDPDFLAAWREYESRYAAPISAVVFADLFSELGFSAAGAPTTVRTSIDAQWAMADEDAETQAAEIENVLKFAQFEIQQNHRELPAEFRSEIENGISAWTSLKQATGFDLRGVFRRRDLVPFVLIPRHVAQSHGEVEKLSLFTLLQQAHDAFVLGVPFAALALMRSILELVLREHYGAVGEDLKQRIDICHDLPSAAPKPALHRLRRLVNDILHVNKEDARLPKDLEKEVLGLLGILRVLIERAPARSPSGQR
jgi:hypothetical protein